jgi:DNA-binding beta-propeller fold protein YncE
LARHSLNKTPVLAPRRPLLLAVLGAFVLLALAAASAAHAADTIYWSNLDGNSISYANLGGSGGGDLPIGPGTLDGPMGLAIDTAAGKIYWSNYGILGGAGTGTSIGVAKLDGSDAHVIPITGAPVNGPHGVAIDPAARKIYWTNHDNNTGNSWIGYANLDGSNGGILNTGSATVEGPRGLAIDPAGGKIYWANWNGNTISFARLDGGGGADLATGTATVHNPEGVAVDMAHGRLYFGNFPSDAFMGTISYVNLNGTGGADFPTGAATVDHPHGVAIDPVAGRIYWPNFGANIISYASLDGSGGADLDTAGATKDGPDLPVLLETPLGTRAPDVTGKPDSTLRCTQGVWADERASLDYRSPASYSYQWIMGSKPIAGATSSSIKARAVADYRCQVTARDAAGSGVQTSAAYGVFRIGKPRLNRKKGTAILPVTVPGRGTLTLRGKGIGKQRLARLADAVAARKVRHAGRVKLLIKPKGKTARRLARRHKLGVKVKLAYKPRGGITSARQKKLKLVERR